MTVQIDDAVLREYVAKMEVEMRGDGIEPDGDTYGELLEGWANEIASSASSMGFGGWGLRAMVPAVTTKVVREPVDAVDWEWVARRLMILGDFGCDTQLMGARHAEPGFLSDDWLTAWYGEPVRPYVQEALDAVPRQIT